MIIQYIYNFENILYYKLENFTLKDFMKKDNLKTDTMIESQVQKCIFILYILEIRK